MNSRTGVGDCRGPVRSHILELSIKDLNNRDARAVCAEGMDFLRALKCTGVTSFIANRSFFKQILHAWLVHQGLYKNIDKTVEDTITTFIDEM